MLVDGLAGRGVGGAEMISEIDHDTVLVEEEIEGDAPAGMEDGVEAKSLCISEMEVFDVGGLCRVEGGIVVKIEVDEPDRLS